MTTPRHSLMLGGGGVSGIARMTGLLYGLEEAGFDPTGSCGGGMLARLFRFAELDDQVEACHRS